MKVAELKKRFTDIYGAGEVMVFEAAGRVNLIGEHIDYNGGLVLPAALSLKSRVLARKRSDSLVNMQATTISGSVTLDLTKLNDYRDLKWGNYQAGVAYVLQQHGYKLCGCDLLFDCEVPFGSGLSSSAAIEVCTALMFMELGGNKYTLVDLAVLSREAENTYAGVNCGIMDQFASSLGKKNNAIMLNCANLDYSYVPLDFGDYCLILGNTKKPRSLIVSKYNERRAECDEALAILKPLTGIENLAELSAQDYDKYADLLRPVVRNRVMHVMGECARVKMSADALARGDNAAFGQLLNESHASLKDLYEVTGRELDSLAHAAQQTEGVLGSRMTGAGFGGCTVSLVRKDCADSFIESVGKRYKEETGLTAEFYIAEICSGARVIKD